MTRWYAGARPRLDALLVGLVMVAWVLGVMRLAGIADWL